MEVSSLSQRQTEATDLAGETGVDDLGSQIHDKATDQGRVNGEIHLNGALADHRLNLFGEGSLLLLRKRLGRCNLRQGHLAGLPVQLKETGENGIERNKALAISQNLEKVHQGRLERFTKKSAEGFLLGIRFEDRRGHRIPEGLRVGPE